MHESLQPSYIIEPFRLASHLISTWT